MTSPASPARVWTVVAAVVALALAQAVAAVVLVLAKVHVPHGDPAAAKAGIEAAVSSGPFLLAGMCASVCALGLVTAAAVAASPVPWRRRLALPSLRAATGDVLLLAALAVGAGSVATSVATLTGRFGTSILARFAAAAAGGSPAFVAALVGAGAMAAVLEELFFRGYVQTRLVARFGAWAGIVASAALFGLVHLDLVQGTMAFCFGLAVGFVAHKRGTVAPGIWAHALNNAFAFVSAKLTAGDTGASMPAGVLGAALLVLAALALRRRFAGVTPAREEPAAAPAKGGRPLAVGCGVAVFGVAAIVVLAGSAVATLAILGRPKDVEARRAEGHAFARDHDERACVERALAIAVDGPHGISARVFLEACLRDAAPSAGFCDGVPAALDLGAHGAWARGFCAAHGYAGSRGCATAVSAVPWRCGRR